MTNENIKQFENLVQDCMASHQAVGMAVTLVDKAGKTLYEQFFGEKKVGTSQSIDGETIFGLASLTKSFTCLAILKMQEEGLLNIEDPVSKYLPTYKGLNQGEEVCIKHFMRHSAGYFPQSRIVVDVVAAELGLDETLVGDLINNPTLEKEGLKRVASRLDAQTEFIGKPGEYFSYCNDGYGLLSAIICRHGGEDSYGQYLVESLLKPLGMNRSFCDFVKPLVDDNRANLYSVIGGELVAVKDYRDNAFVLNGGGAMKATLNDLKKYIGMYLNDGTGLNGVALAPSKVIKAMTTIHQEDDYISDYGYGLNLKKIENISVAGHGGSLPGVSSHMIWSQEKGVGAIVLCNTEDVPVGGLAEALLKMGLGFEPTRLQHHYENKPWSSGLLDEARGVYASDEGTQVELCVDEKGKAILKSGSKISELIMIEPDHAVVSSIDGDTYLQMIRDKKRGVFGMRYGSRILPRKK